MRRPITNDDRYVYLISHFGLVVDYANSWEPSKHKPLLLYMQDFIDGQIPIAGWDCIDGQRSLLLGQITNQMGRQGDMLCQRKP